MNRRPASEGAEPALILPPLWIGPEIQPLVCIYRCELDGRFHYFRVCDSYANGALEPVEGSA